MTKKQKILTILTWALTLVWAVPIYAMGYKAYVFNVPIMAYPITIFLAGILLGESPLFNEKKKK